MEERERWETPVDDLPTEVMMHIFSYADPIALLHSESVSRRWRDIATSDLCWQEACNTWLGGTKYKNTIAASWKSRCLRAYRTYRKLILAKATPFEILYWACACGHHVIVSKVLRENNGVLEERGGVAGGALIHRCIIGKSAVCAEMLAMRGANVDTPDERSKDLPIVVAARRGLFNIVEVLLSCGTDFRLLFMDQKIVTKKRQPILHQIAQLGHIRIAQLWIEKAIMNGEDIKQILNAPNPKTWRPLHCAAHGRKDEMVEFLLSHGADINMRTIRDHGCKTPLQLAFEGQHLSTMAVLLNRGAMIDPPFLLRPKNLPLSTIYHEACTRNCIEIVKLFLQRGADPNWKVNRRGPLHFAVTNKAPNLQFFEFMLQQGADVNLQGDVIADTPILLLLHEGLTLERIPLLHFLLDHGALLDVPGAISMNPLRAFLTYNRLNSEELVFDITKKLVEHGATMKLGQVTDHNILNIAARKYSVPLLEFLLVQDGAVLNPSNHMSPLATTLLEYANRTLGMNAIRLILGPSLKRLLANAEWLIARGADLNHMIGRFPWWYSNLRGGHEEGIHLLCELGINFNWLPSDPPQVSYLWARLEDFYRMWNFLDSFSHYLFGKKFVLTLAELGVNFDCTNADGQNVVQYTQSCSFETQATLRGGSTYLSQWLAVLEEAILLSRATRARVQNEKEKSK